MKTHHDNLAARKSRTRLTRRSPKSRGAVMVLALLGGFMIVGLIGYAFNTGRHAQLQQQTQSAADATVISGAGYVARSFNTVAMNNVEISRLIAVVQMLDAVPLATEYTLLDVRATLERVEEQLGQGVCPVSEDVLTRLVTDADQYASDNFGSLFNGMTADLEALIRSDTGNIFNQGSTTELEELAELLYEQERLLEEMDEFFNRGSYDVREMTFYDSEFGRGELWKAMESLDAISLATMEQLEELTQVTAIHAGRRNMRGSSGETMAAVAPFDRAIDWQRYDFDDFRNPVVRGRLPDWVDDELTNRGPYDTIFGWQIPHYENVGGGSGGGSGSTTTVSQPGSPWSGNPTSNGGGGNAQWELESYSTYGPYQWLRHRLATMVDEPEVLENSQFVTRVNRMSGNKLNYLWPGSARTWVFLDPQWITSYDQAVDIIESGTPRVAYTQFLRMDYELRYVFLPYDKTLLQAIGANAPYRTERNTSDWEVIRPRRGHTNVPGLERTCDYIWDDSWQRLGDDRERSLIRVSSASEHESVVNKLRRNDNYTLYKADRTEYQSGDDPAEVRWVEYPVVRTDIGIYRFIWAGINVGPDVIIRDPNNFASRADLPAPLDFNHAAMVRPADGAVGYPGSPFTFLGLSKQPNAAPMWRQLFNTSAYDGHAGIAQASVFNNHSWDLWTQMWHAQLEPVQDYSQWVDLIQNEIDLALGYDDLSVSELEEMAEYLRSLETLAPIMLTH